MGYQALYRVWRPQRFQDIAGQEAITQTLKNALIQGKSSHAYLFTGPRGTGKTSAAKIFSKAINCHFLKDGEPCNECPTCLAITSGQLNDVIEIDAASNNGVEEIRDIRDKAKYAPTEADYKVYIIDEVHMLSTGAFNALLKTLEEPPKNVIFILATTEPHKIPATIISRTQRFDFKRITTRDIIARMKVILDGEKIGFEEPALQIIAKAAEGGMRDALSILDQVISYGEQFVTEENALNVTGALTQELLITYMNAVAQRETEAGLTLLQQILAEGKDPVRLVEDLILFARDLLVYQKAPQMTEGIESTITEEFKQLSELISAEVLYQVIGILNEGQNEMRFTNHPGIYLEVATVKMTQLRGNVNPPVASVAQAPAAAPADQAVMQQMEQKMAAMAKQIETMMSQGVTAGSASQTPQAKPKKKPNTNGFRVNTTGIFQVLGEATRQDLDLLKDVWPDLMNMLSVTQRAVMKASTPVAASPTALIVSFEYEILCQKASDDAALLETIAQSLEKLIQRKPNMLAVPHDVWPNLRSTYIEQAKQGKLPGAEPTTADGQAQAAEAGQPAVAPTPTSEMVLEEMQAAPPPEEENAIITEAVALFGEELVQVIEE
ncbi:DNA polymerase III subunit gamma/tau [Isobaculum melis]|uniref:DNA-directed DNA polymerase n=1 Tax=Isobaculum melis TaxID=142588 RepID=A0A1H9SNJ7_9LACT|nr:DNA polymerase III subunit gamma/tau [Isobaculum melis]SER86474.1 DNA polymerase III, tau subunit [Isobaculum melis]